MGWMAEWSWWMLRMLDAGRVKLVPSRRRSGPVHSELSSAASSFFSAFRPEQTLYYVVDLLGSTGDRPCTSIAPQRKI